MSSAFPAASRRAAADESTPSTDRAAQPGRSDAESPRIAIEVENPRPLGIVGDGPTIVALIEIEAGLLTFDNIRAVLQAVLLHEQWSGWRLTHQQPILQLQTFGLLDPFLSSQPDAGGAQLFLQKSHDEFAPFCEGPAGELHHKPFPVPIDDQPREFVGLAEDQSASFPLGLILEQPPSQRDGLLEPLRPVGLIQRLLFLACVQPHPNVAVGVEQSPGDKRAIVCKHVDLGPRLGVAFDLGDRTGKQPGMAAEERQARRDLSVTRGSTAASASISYSTCAVDSGVDAASTSSR